MVDRLQYAKKLEEVGLTSSQAKFLCKVFDEELIMRSEYKEQQKLFEQKLDSFKQEVDQKFIIFEQRLIIRLGAILLISLTIMKTFLK